jgi:hypothetical protein
MAAMLFPTKTHTEKKMFSKKLENFKCIWHYKTFKLKPLDFVALLFEAIKDISRMQLKGEESTPKYHAYLSEVHVGRRFGSKFS